MALRMSLPALLILAASGTLAASASLAAGEALTYGATLDSGSEVPPTQAKGTGQVTATYDPASKQLSWSGSYGGLTGPVTAAHFHGPAGSGENAGVLIPVTATSSPFSGQAVLDDAKAADLEAGKLYFNIHTAANPKGEIRGQVVRAR
jgi:hypothetical protein